MNKWVIHFTATFIAFLIFSGTCKAEPDSTIQYLMDEPVSLFDLGIFKMRSELDSKFETKDRLVAVDYKWPENRIVITFLFPSVRFENEYEAKERCIEFVEGIRREFDVNPKSGDPPGPYSAFRISRYFEHSGYSKKNRPNDLSDQLYELIKIKGSMHLKNNDAFSCQAPLAGTAIYFSKENN